MTRPAPVLRPRAAARRRADAVARWLFLGATLLGLVVLAYLLYRVARRGLPWLDWQFLTSLPSRLPQRAGVWSALVGTVYLIALTAPLAGPIGVGAAVYLEEYARPGRLSAFIETNIANLAGVPSIVYGMLGLTVFVRMMDLGRSVLAGALTMALLVLPLVIVASREAIRAVPLSLREGAFALGATRWQVVRHIVLPQAAPGILTGMILAVSRAIGETAPLITIGALMFVPFVPASPFDSFTVLPIQIFNWTSRPQAAFQDVAAAGILVLLIVLLAMNSAAIYLRARFEKRGHRP